MLIYLLKYAVYLFNDGIGMERNGKLSEWAREKITQTRQGNDKKVIKKDFIIRGSQHIYLQKFPFYIHFSYLLFSHTFRSIISSV